MAPDLQSADSEASRMWHNVLCAEGEGTYFPTEHLAKLFSACSSQAETKRRELALYSDKGIFELMRYTHGSTGELASNALESLKAQGFGRLAFAGKGARSLFFYSTPDRSGRQQLVGLTPLSDAYIDCPLVLPAIAHSIIQGPGRHGIQLRVMPALEPSKRADHDTLKRLEEAMGLEFGDLEPDNIRILNFTNSKGEAKRVPMIIDWGALKPIAPGILKTKQKKWESMPALADWHEAQAYLRNHYEIEHVLPGRRAIWEMRQAGFDPANLDEAAVAFDVAEKHGLYVPEAASYAAEAQKDAGKPFAESVKGRIEKADLSQFHKGK